MSEVSVEVGRQVNRKDLFIHTLLYSRKLLARYELVGVTMLVKTVGYLYMIE